MTALLIALIASIECLLLSLIIVVIAVAPALLVGMSVPVRTQALMVSWGGVVVALAAIAVNL